MKGAVTVAVAIYAVCVTVWVVVQQSYLETARSGSTSRTLELSASVSLARTLELFFELSLLNYAERDLS